MAGKADWGSNGLPLEGSEGCETRAAAFMRRDMPMCRPDERLQDVRGRVGEWESCFVVDHDGVLAGLLGRSALRRDDDISAEQAMTDGPSTIRPSARLAAAVERMHRRDLTSLPVTNSDGRLVGLLRLDDAEAALQATPGGRE